jgi:hypothetical protein
MFKNRRVAGALLCLSFPLGHQTRTSMVATAKALILTDRLSWPWMPLPVS